VKLRNPWLIRLVAFVGAWLLRVLLASLCKRFRYADGKVHPTDPRRDPYIYVFWHEGIVLGAVFRARVKVLIGRHADGEMIAQVCRHLGLGTVRGSPKEGGVEAMLGLLKGADRTHVVVTPDGPRGPRRHVKLGVVFLASRTGLPVVPVGVAARGWRLRSWDRFLIPRPGTRTCYVIGNPICVPPDLDRRRMEHYRLAIESGLVAATGTAERWAGCEEESTELPGSISLRAGA
jgi:lysophospholipid acyltransferase (LPLAT)-like uncharacterized protein